jgi:hypothetical protein
MSYGGLGERKAQRYLLQWFEADREAGRPPRFHAALSVSNGVAVLGAQAATIDPRHDESIRSQREVGGTGALQRGWSGGRRCAFSPRFRQPDHPYLGTVNSRKRFEDRECRVSGDGTVEPTRPRITEVTIYGLLCNVPNRVTVRKKTFCRIRPMVRLRKLCEYLTVH